MNEKSFITNIESVELFRLDTNQPICTFERVVSIEPPPPSSVYKFIRYLKRSTIPVLTQSLILFCTDTREELIDYFRLIGIEASKLFYVSVMVCLNKGQYDLLMKLYCP